MRLELVSRCVSRQESAQGEALLAKVEVCHTSPSCTCVRTTIRRKLDMKEVLRGAALRLQVILDLVLVHACPFESGCKARLCQRDSHFGAVVEWPIGNRSCSSMGGSCVPLETSFICYPPTPICKNNHQHWRIATAIALSGGGKEEKLCL